MAKVNAYEHCTMFSDEGTLLNKEFHIGVFGDDTGVSMLAPDGSNTRPLLGLFPNLKSTDAVLAANSVVAGLHSRFLINKAQTNSVSVLGAQLQVRPKASCANGMRAALWAYYEQSGTAAMSAGLDCAIAASVESAGATFSAVTMTGINIDSSVTAGATVTNFSAIRVTGAAKCFDYLIDVAAGGTPVVAVARFTAIANVISKTGTPTTQAGYLKVYIDTSAFYIHLYTTA